MLNFNIDVNFSLLTRVYELKEPVYNPLILNALDLSFRELVTFILYILAQSTRFALQLILCSIRT